MGMRRLDLGVVTALASSTGLLLELVELVGVDNIVVSATTGDSEEAGIIIVLGFSLFDLTGVCAIVGVTNQAELATKTSASRLRVC